jgi:hypothetical protein
MADILRHIQHDRAGAAGSGDREGSADEFGDALRALDAKQFLAGGAEDLHLSRFLRHVLPRVVAVRVAGDRDQRDAGVERFHQARDEVRGPRSERRIHDARAVGHARPGVRGEGAAAFIIDQVMLQAEGAHRLVEGQELEAAHAEHRADMMGLQHASERLAAGDGQDRVGLVHVVLASASRVTASRTVPPGRRPRAAARALTAETMPVATAERPSPIRAVQAE